MSGSVHARGDLMKTKMRTTTDLGSGERLRTLSDAELSAVAGGSIQPSDPPDPIAILPGGEASSIQPDDPPGG